MTKANINRVCLFAAALSMTADDAEALQDALLAAANSQEAQQSRQDAFGQRYTIDFKLEARQKRYHSEWLDSRKQLRNAAPYHLLPSVKREFRHHEQRN